MKRVQTAVAMVAAFFVLGCATPYIITLQDGSTVESKDEPEFDEDSGFYELETRTGEEMMLNKDAIRSIKALDD
jgi:hypothetical protein